jgi:hypothetical protein
VNPAIEDRGTELAYIGVGGDSFDFAGWVAEKIDMRQARIRHSVLRQSSRVLDALLNTNVHHRGPSR